MINVAILGYGTVGSGVYEVIKTNLKVITKLPKDLTSKIIYASLVVAV